MHLITPEQREQLLANGHTTASGRRHDPRPVVKLFMPDGAGTWLLTELDPNDPDRAFGLCDVGLGSPEIGYVSLRELAMLRGRLGLAIERDDTFCPSHPISWYADRARRRGIVTD